ncbi:MAG: hypothetical protein AB1765_09725, partial [Candidatus Hydrogenedentota bacterium]
SSDKTMMIKDSKIERFKDYFRIPNFLKEVGFRLQATGYGLQPAGTRSLKSEVRSQHIIYFLPFASCFLLLASYFLLPTSSYCRITDDLRLGAYPASMGGAFVAMSEGYHSLYWNPAGLSKFQGLDISDLFIPQPYGVDDINQNYLAVAYGDSIRRFGAGLAMRYLGADLEYGSAGGSIISSVDYDEFEWIVGGGVRVMTDWYVGMNYKHYSIESSLRGTELSISGNAMDIGTIYYVRPLDLNLGAMIRNFSCDFGKEDIDPTYRIGLSKSFIDNHIRFAIDVSEENDAALNDADFRLHAGCEFLPVKEFGIRIGYDDEDITGGFGVYFGSAGLEYAYVDNDRLEGTHQVSLSYRFGKPKSVKELEKEAEKRKAKIAEKEEEKQPVMQKVKKEEVVLANDYSIWIENFRGIDVPDEVKWLEMAIKDIMINYFKRETDLTLANSPNKAYFIISGTYKKTNDQISIYARITDKSERIKIETVLTSQQKIFNGCEQLAEKIIRSIK